MTDAEHEAFNESFGYGIMVGAFFLFGFVLGFNWSF